MIDYDRMLKNFNEAQAYTERIAQLKGVAAMAKLTSTGNYLIAVVSTFMSIYELANHEKGLAAAFGGVTLFSTGAGALISHIKGKIKAQVTELEAKKNSLESKVEE